MPGTGISPPNLSLFGKTAVPSPVISLSSSSVDEDEVIGATVGALSVTDGSGSYTFSITADPDSKFDIDGSDLTLLDTLDYETGTSHSVTVEADNGVDDPITRSFTITVNNVLDAATLDELSGTFTLAEDSEEDDVAGSIVGKTSGSTLSLIDDAGGRVKLSGTSVVAGQTGLDYEANTSHDFTIRETLADSPNSPRDTELTLTVTDVDEVAPTLSSPTGSATSDTEADLSVSTNEGNGTLYWFVSTSASPPSAANLKTGTGAVDSGSQAVSATGTQNAAADGLTAETTYYAHFLHRDATGNDSSIVTSSSFTTDEAADEDYLLIINVTTEASATPSTTALTIDAAATGFRVWSGTGAAGEGEWLLYVKKNAGAVFAVAMEQWWGRILHAAPGDTFAFGTSDGRTLQMAQMIVPTSLIVPSGATGTANCDEALPLIWEPSAPHITLPGNGSAFQIDADGTERWVFIAELDADNVWSPPRVVRISDTRDTTIQCNFAAIAIANEAGATLDITAPTGSTIGGTKGVMSLDTIPAVTGTTHNVSTMAQFKTAIATAVSGDAIAAATATYAFDIAITDASFVANELMGNQGAEGILIYGTTGDRDDVILTGNGTSTNGSWTLTQGGATGWTSFKDLTLDLASQAIKFTGSGGKFNFDNVLAKGGTGTDILNFNNAAGALTVRALHTLVQDGAGDLWNFDGNATHNAASLVELVGCSGLRPGPANNSYQCATTHNELHIRIHGGLWSDAHLNVFANGNSTSYTYAEFATITKGARTSGIANTHLYCCDWEVNPATTGNSTLLAAIGNHVTGAKGATSYGTFRNCPIVERNVIAVTSGRGVHNSIEADINGNIIIGADTAIRNADAASLMASSDINFNTIVSNTTGINHATTTNDPAVFNSNAAKSNGTSVNTTAGAKTSLTGNYNVLDATVDTDYTAGANDTTGTDAALDSDYFPTASGNCDDNGDYSKLGHVGGADPWGFVFAYKQNVAPRGARSRPIIRASAELYPDVY